MNTRRCLSCGDPLEMTSRADRRTCSDLCRKRMSLARRAECAVPAPKRARQALITAPEGHRATSGSSRESRGLQP
jgi:predicted nucleic acid-binding Zn ribbon protein